MKLVRNPSWLIAVAAAMAGCESVPEKMAFELPLENNEAEYEAFMAFAPRRETTATSEKFRYESAAPLLPAEDRGKIRGFAGTVRDLNRIFPTNALPAGFSHELALHAWRGERVNAQIELLAGEALAGVKVVPGEFRTADGVRLAADAVRARFVRFTKGVGGELIPDILDTAPALPMPKDSFRAVWISAAVPRDAASGVYRGEIVASAQGGAEVRFAVTLTVSSRTLPAAKEWSYHLDLWQHPFAIARYYHVKPFSKAHYEILRPFLRELGESGQKALTVTIQDIPWMHQNYDAYHSMIGRTKTAAGWTFDYALFDEYVAFGRETCGIGPQIHCYSIVPWRNRVSWTDERGARAWAVLKPGTAEHTAYWKPFLADFERHLKAKGWIGETYIALDERDPEEVAAIAKLIKDAAPGLKMQMAGNRMPSDFKGIRIDSYSQIMNHIDRPFLKETDERRRAGMVTTYYICCIPRAPNTLMSSGAYEGAWAGLYPEAAKLDGLLRWSWTNWPADPLADTGWFANGGLAGDQFLVYPGEGEMLSSVRWEMLRDGVEEAVKIRMLRPSGADLSAVDAALKKMDFDTYSQFDVRTVKDDWLRVQSAVREVK